MHKHHELPKENELPKIIVNEIMLEQDLSNPEGIARSMDYETAKVLELVPSRKEFCIQLIEEINKAHHSCRIQEKRSALEVLKENILGKLFYMYLQDNHYLVIDKLTAKELKEQILKEVDIIESSPDNAILYLDALERGGHRNFINGIVSYIYPG